jgi:3-hydroxyacyl-CoA dehydrogenase
LRELREGSDGRSVQEGVTSARDIDKALKLGLNHPIGPFEMVDLVGWTRASAFFSSSMKRWVKSIGPVRSW